MRSKCVFVSTRNQDMATRTHWLKPFRKICNFFGNKASENRFSCHFICAEREEKKSYRQRWMILPLHIAITRNQWPLPLRTSTREIKSVKNETKAATITICEFHKITLVVAPAMQMSLLPICAYIVRIASDRWIHRPEVDLVFPVENQLTQFTCRLHYTLCVIDWIA